VLHKAARHDINRTSWTLPPSDRTTASRLSNHAFRPGKMVRVSDIRCKNVGFEEIDASESVGVNTACSNVVRSL